MLCLKLLQPLLIKLIRWYILSTQCKNNFWVICLTTKWNSLCKKTCYEILSSKTGGNIKPLCFRNCKKCVHSVKTHSGSQWILQLYCERYKTTKYRKWWTRYKKIGEKLQEKNESILHNKLNNARWNHITDTIKEFDHHLPGELENFIWMSYNPFPFLKEIIPL